MDARYSNPDEDLRGPWLSNDLTAAGERSAGHFDVKSPSGTAFDSPQGKHWLYSEHTIRRLIADNRIWFGKHGTAFPRLKRFLSEVQQGRRANTLWFYDEVGSTDEATKELRSLFPELQGDFQTPKPARLIRQMLQIATTKDNGDLVVDFFAGSGTTAESVFRLNKEDGGKRKVVLVQLPETTERNDFPTISDITKERVRRVINKLNEQDAEQLDLKDSTQQDRGFRAFKLDTSNFTPWDGEQPEDVDSVAKQLDLHVEHILTGRSQEDILTELLLKSGFPLSTKVEQIELAGKKVFSVEEGAMLVCLEEELTNDVIKAIAEKKPSRVICLDAGFHGNDQLKTNAVQTMKARGVTSFRTV
jgi:adenine-specific DNA-methyltransferase